MTEQPKTIQNVIVVVAMASEARPFVEHLDLEPNTDFFPPEVPFLAYSGSHHGCALTVVTNGVDHVYGSGVDNCGTVPASLVTFLALQKDPDCDLIINAGTCGGFASKGAEIGDVFLTTGVANHDRRIPIPPFIPYGIGKINTIAAPHLVTKHGFKTGICTTGNSLDATEEDRKHMLANDASCKDMEAAAVAWSCQLYKKPYLGVKVVTDIVDGDRATHEEFLENLHKAADSLQMALPKVIEHICGRRFDDL